MTKPTEGTTRRALLHAAIAAPGIAAASAALAHGEGCDRERSPAAPPAIDTKQMPRIEPLVYEQTDEPTRRLWDQLRPPPGGPTQHPGVEHDLFRISMHDPDLFRVQSPYVQYLKNSTVLPLRYRELAILRSAWLGGVDDQFVNHSKIGMAAGLSREDVDRVPKGPDAPGWSAEDRAVLRGVDELNAWCRIGDESWAALARQFDKRQMIEFLVLVGNYRTLSYIQNSVGIRPVTGKSPNIPGNHFLFPAA